VLLPSYSYVYSRVCTRERTPPICEDLGREMKYDDGDDECVVLLLLIELIRHGLRP